MDTSSLMEQILSKDNLNAAYLQVVRNKGAAGVDGMTVEELGAYLSENGESIREQLRTRKYKPQPVRRVEIPKPDGGVRNLGVPTVVDRFVQQAVAQVLTPIFEEKFHDHSYGFRPNRCAQQAVLKALEMMNDGHSWIVDIDLAKFFDTVDHDKLMTIFGRTIKDGDVISVVRKFLVSGVMIDDEYEDTIVGTPQGGLCRYPHKPPCGDPSSVSMTTPFSITPLLRYLFTIWITRSSLISFRRRFTRIVWFRVSKYFERSRLTAWV